MEDIKFLNKFDKASAIKSIPPENFYGSTILGVVLYRLHFVLTNSKIKNRLSASDSVFRILKEFFADAFEDQDYILALLLNISRSFIDPDHKSVSRGINTLNDNLNGEHLKILEPSFGELIQKAKIILSDIWQSKGFISGLRSLLLEYFDSDEMLDHYSKKEIFELYFNSIVWLKGLFTNLLIFFF